MPSVKKVQNATILLSDSAIQQDCVKAEGNSEEFEAIELSQQTESDRVLLKLFQDALKTGKLQRAQELAACLHLQRSLEGALKLTNLHKIPQLAERIDRLLSSRLEEEEDAQANVPLSFVTPPPPSFTQKTAEQPFSNDRPGTQQDPTIAAVTEVSGNVERNENAPHFGGRETKSFTHKTGTGSSLDVGGEPFVRAGNGILTESTRNTLFPPKGLEDNSGKRKHISANPFMRRAKPKS